MKKFTGSNTIAVEGADGITNITFDNAIIAAGSSVVDLPFIEFIYSFLNGLRYDISVIGYFTLPVLLIYIFVLLFGKIFPLINSIFQEFIRYYGITITAFIFIAVFV